MTPSVLLLEHESYCRLHYKLPVLSALFYMYFSSVCPILSFLIPFFYPLKYNNIVWCQSSLPDPFISYLASLLLSTRLSTFLVVIVASFVESCNHTSYTNNSFSLPIENNPLHSGENLQFPPEISLSINWSMQPDRSLWDELTYMALFFRRSSLVGFMNLQLIHWLTNQSLSSAAELNLS